MRLIDLDPTFRRFLGDGWHEVVKKIKNADGLMFLCPKCFVDNGGPVGTHGIICWTPRVPDDASPGPGRWTLRGTGMNDLTVHIAPGKSRSILLIGGCAWHGYVTDGLVTNA